MTAPVWPMQKVVSLALFRHAASAYEDPRCGPWAGRFFARHLPAVIRAHHACFRGWTLRIHHDDSVYHSYYGAALFRLRDAGLVDLRYCGPAETLCGSMLWRTLPCWDPRVARVVCRDLDACPSPRDRRCIEDWIASGESVHAVHDSMSHTGPLMGGMCAFDARAWRARAGVADLPDLLAQARARGINLDQHGADQVALNLVVWPRLCGSSMVHQLKGNTPEPRAARRPVAIAAPAPAPADMPPAVAAGGDACAPHIGAMFDHVKAAGFYAGLGGPVHDLCAAAEAETGEPAANAPVDPPTRAVFASDLSDDYAFFLPLTALAWRRVTGYRPTAVLIGSPAEWLARGPSRLALEQARAQGADLYFMPPVPGHRPSTAAQVARVFAACLPVPDETYLITSDADMWPLCAAPYDRMPRDDRMTSWYANAYLKEEGGRLVPEGKYPICFIGAKKSVWREVTGAAGGIYHETAAALGLLPADADGSRVWNYDEAYLGARIHAWAGYPARFVPLDRRGGPPVDRICRSAWNEPDTVRARATMVSPDGGPMMDAHLPRPAWHDDQWPKVRSLLARVLPAYLGWADRYRAAYVTKIAAEGRR